MKKRGSYAAVEVRNAPFAVQILKNQGQSAPTSGGELI